VRIEKTAKRDVRSDETGTQTPPFHKLRAMDTKKELAEEKLRLAQP